MSQDLTTSTFQDKFKPLISVNMLLEIKQLNLILRPSYGLQLCKTIYLLSTFRIVVGPVFLLRATNDGNQV